MNFSCVQRRALVGIDAPLAQVEVHASNGLPNLSIVGLPETAVKESKDRVRSALLKSGFDLPPNRITINLAPALEGHEFYGELGLNDLLPFLIKTKAAGQRWVIQLPGLVEALDYRSLERQGLA